MEQKKLIIIGVLCVVICIFAGAIFGILTNTVNYERVELAANGTTIEIPTINATYQGEINDTGIKLWTFKQGRLISYNSEEALSGSGLYGLAGAIAFKDIKDLVFNHFKKQEKVDDFIVYTLDANVMNPEGKGEIYCIMLTNNDTHDNIVIVAGTQDIALHMAKSVQYKVPNVTSSGNGAGAAISGTPKNTTNNNSKIVHTIKGDFLVGEIVYDNGYKYRVNADGSLTPVEGAPSINDGSGSGSSQSSPGSDERIEDTRTPEPTPTPTPSYDSEGSLV